ncbi:MAG: hypothetical protein ACP5OE_08935 [Thermodesulfobium sp.]
MILPKMDAWNSIRLKYRGYIGHFTFDEEKNIFFGRVSNTHDVITFQGKSVENVKRDFQKAVSDYIAGVKKHNKSHEKLFS